MKIVQALGWYFPDSLGGTEVYVRGLASRLRKAGHEVLVAAPEPGLDGERTYEFDGAMVFRYGTPSNPTRAECQDWVVTRGAERLHAWLQGLRPEVAHFHTFVTGLGLKEIQAAKSTGAKVIVTTHASSLGYTCQRGTMMRLGREACDGLREPAKCAACVLQSKGMNPMAARGLALIPPSLGTKLLAREGRWSTAIGMSALIERNGEKQRAFMDAADAFVVLTEWARKIVIQNGAPTEKVKLNRLGLSQSLVARKSNRPTQSPVRLGYLGRFERIKGAEVLARAFATLPKELPIVLEFRGPADPAATSALKSILKDDPRVMFAPPVPPEEAPTILAGYDALVCPSLCMEGGPTVAIEAHAAGTPVIGSGLGGLAELIDNGVNGRLVPPGDAAMLAEVLREIAANPANTIDAWRPNLPAARTMDEIAADYLRLYASEN